MSRQSNETRLVESCVWLAMMPVPVMFYIIIIWFSYFFCISNSLPLLFFFLWCIFYLLNVGSVCDLLLKHYFIVIQMIIIQILWWLWYQTKIFLDFSNFPFFPSNFIVYLWCVLKCQSFASFHSILLYHHIDCLIVEADKCMTLLKLNNWNHCSCVTVKVYQSTCK